MRIYEAMFDLTSVVHCADEEEYRLAAKFLTEIGARCGPSLRPDEKKSVFRIETVEQLESFGRFWHALEARRTEGLAKDREPISLEMDIDVETLGVRMTITWASEKDYQLGTKFLTDMGLRSSLSRDRKRVLFYLENEQQFESLLRFRQSLNEKHK